MCKILSTNLIDITKFIRWLSEDRKYILISQIEIKYKPLYSPCAVLSNRPWSIRETCDIEA